MQSHSFVRSFLLPGLAALALALGGCGTDPDPGSGEGEGEPGRPCGIDQIPTEPECTADCICQAQECGPLSDGSNPQCDEDKVCELGRCVDAECNDDADCADQCDDTPSCLCIAQTCQAKCRVDTDCGNTEGENPQARWCTSSQICADCDCGTRVDCDGLNTDDTVFDCQVDRAEPDSYCTCVEVTCRPAFDDCGEAESCQILNGRAVCVPDVCDGSNSNCANPQQHCDTDRDQCICGDGINRGDCAPESCRTTEFCQENFGPLFLCKDWNCAETACNDDDDCDAPDTLGTECGEEGKCVLRACTEDAECPRRREVEPLPTGVFYCHEDNRVCTQGCRDNDDCLDSRKCEDHACVPRNCDDAGDCERARWCNFDSADLPDGADGGICEAGCDEQDDCGVHKPCRRDEHACGCRVDGDCTILDPTFVCDDGSGDCKPPCLEHTDCGQNEACIGGKCLSGECRNDAFEPNDIEEESDTLPFEQDRQNERSFTYDDILRLCGEPGPHWDVADWFEIRVNQFDELRATITWPMVDTDDDGWGDTAGACDLEAAELSVSLWYLDEDGERRREAQALVEPPGANQPCSVEVAIRQPAPRATSYFVAISNEVSSVVDYRLQVQHDRTIECLDDDYEPNDAGDGIGDAEPIFDCEQFLRDGGTAEEPVVVHSLTLCRDDIDWLNIRLRQRDQIHIRGVYDGRLGELAANLFAPIELGFPVPLADGPGQDGEFTLSEDGGQIIVDGDHRLRVTALLLDRPVQTSYRLEIWCHGEEEPCIDDPFEVNDSADTGYCLNNEDGVQPCDVIEVDDWRFQHPDPDDEGAPLLHLCENGAGANNRDEDWYTLQLRQGASVQIATTNELGPPPHTWFIELDFINGATGEVIQRSAQAGELNQIIIRRRQLAAGAYHIRVSHPVNVLGRTVPYDLDVIVRDGDNPCEDDNFEQNDSLANAAEIVVPPVEDPEEDWTCLPLVEDAHLGLCQDQLGFEEDWYEVDLSGIVAQRIDVQLRCVHGLEGDWGDLDVELRIAGQGGEVGTYACPQNIDRDGACRDLTEGPCGPNPQNYPTMSLDFPRAEPHYIRAWSFGGGQNLYDLCVKVIVDVCEDDIYEPNNVRQQANDAGGLLLNQFDQIEGKICPSNDDWWVVNTEEAGDLKVRMVHQNAADLDIQLLDKGGNLIEQNRALGTRPCILAEDLPADEYFVRIWGADPSSEATYDLWVFSADGLSCVQFP